MSDTENSGATAFTAGCPVLAGALDLSRRIHDDFTFDPRATSVTTPVAEFFKTRRGVCQDFAQFNIGGFHQVNAGPGTLHGSLLYGYTRSELELQSTDSSSLDSLLSFPVTQTHIINTAFQYRFRGSSFIPKLAYTFANNGIQKPTNSVIIGVQDVFMRSKLRGSADLLLSQYPKTQTENDLSFGEVLGVTYRIRENQSVNLRQRWISYGSRSSITAGAYYEMFL